MAFICFTLAAFQSVDFACVPIFSDTKLNVNCESLTAMLFRHLNRLEKNCHRQNTRW